VSLSTDGLLAVQSEFHRLLQLLGEASSQTQEAHSDATVGNIRGAAMVLDDALCTLAELETKVSEVAAMAAKWKALAEDLMEGGGE
jgi:hypothetical protein